MHKVSFAVPIWVVACKRVDQGLKRKIGHHSRRCIADIRVVDTWVAGKAGMVP
jgi:hypothetical protein